MGEAREVSLFTLRPEYVPVFGLNDLLDTQQAQEYPSKNKHRDLWAATMHNAQLRSLVARLVVRCRWWACYYDVVVEACQTIFRNHLPNSYCLQLLLAYVRAAAQWRKPMMAPVQLPEPVLCQMYGVAPDEETWDSIIADKGDTWVRSKQAAMQHCRLP